MFSFAFGAPGRKAGEFRDPSGVAVDDASGDVYVTDRESKEVQEFAPVLGGGGALVGERFVREFKVSGADGVAVDDSVVGVDPSRGDVYVVGGGSSRTVYKFTAEGVAVAELKAFEMAGKKGEGRFAAIEGIAVGSDGSLFVYQEDGAIDRFNDAVVNEGVSSVQAGGLGKARPGFAVDSQGDFYAGVQSEGLVAVVAKLEGMTGKLLVAALDGEETTAVAVNAVDVPANGVDEENDVYVDNVASLDGRNVGTVAEFAPAAGGPGGDGLVQRFAAAGLSEPDGVAVDQADGEVYVSDGASDDVDVFALEAAGVPAVEGLSAQGAEALTPDARRLSAQVDPDGAETHYYFEYGQASCAAAPSACIRTPESPVDAGGGFGNRDVGVEVSDLQPGVYHYRAVAENSFGAVDGTEATFTVVTVLGGLADGRAWELVSPADKYGIPVEPLTHEGGWVLASEDGDAITYVSDGSITGEAQGNRAPEAQQVISRRGPGGWATQDIATPNSRASGLEPGHAPEYQFFTPDLSLALVEPRSLNGLAEPPLAPEATQATMYVRDQETGGYLPLLTEADAPGVEFAQKTSFLAATPDLGHVVLQSTVPLTGPGSAPGLYEWAQGRLQFISVLPGAAHTPAAVALLGYDSRVVAHAISSDGTRVVWTSSEEPSYAGHLYMRDTATGQTLQLDAAQGVSEPAVGSAEFQTASSDDSRVFFTDKQKLTPQSSADPEQPKQAGKADLYECEITEAAGKLSCALKDLTVATSEGEHAAVQGLLLGASEDGSSVYLVAHGILANNQTGDGETASAGAENLYALHEQEHDAWRTTFVAGLSSQDSPEWEGDQLENAAYVTARSSPNGRYLAFMSSASPTGYDNLDQNSGKRDEEVYLYDASTEQLTCASCDPTGARPVGVLDAQYTAEGYGLLVDRRLVWEGHWLAGSIPGWTAQSLTSAIYQPRYLSDEGRLFFNSPDDLVPAATNHKEDVYEYEPEGIGSCETSSHGCISLISGGSSPNESAFLEATPNGNDAFFLTTAPLIPQQANGELDLYDARVCTQETPCLTPPAAPSPPCETTNECRPETVTLPATAGPAGSATFTGTGNLTPPAKHEAKGLKTSMKPLTRAQKLANALNACRKQHPRSKKKREACEAHARKLYGPKSKAKKTAKVKAKTTSGARPAGRTG